MSTKTICRSCGEEIWNGDVHRVRIELVNAATNAPRKHVQKEDDFHHACAASVFAVFDGRDVHPRRAKLKQGVTA